jgi:two-component system OmpR family response regulator
VQSVRVLVVDDEEDVSSLVGRALAREGHSVRCAASLAEAEKAMVEAPVDLMVLDLELGDGSGLQLCRAMRRRGDPIPVLLLTAHGEVPRRLEGFDAGADDFLAKPFAVAELRARVRALARRGPTLRPAVASVGGVELDLAARRATRAGEEIPITAREWAILELLLSVRGRVVSRMEILESIWGETSEAASASLDVIIARVRRKLGASVIRTLRGEGYAVDG